MENEPLTDQEKRHIGALKLFLEASDDPEGIESARMLDEFSPDQARAIVARYHLALDDPRAFFVAHKLNKWLSPFFRAWRAITGIFRRKP